MNIAVDLRALGGGNVSGVTVYLRNILNELLKIDKKSNYFLWFNSAREKLDLPEIKTSSRIKLIQTSYPNRWLNYSLLFRDKPKLDELILSQPGRSGEKIDIFWLPDPRPVVLSDGCKLVTTIHDLSLTRFPKFFSYKTRLWHRLLNSKSIASKADRIMAVSQFTAGELDKYWGVSKDKITVTHLGVSKDMNPVTDKTKLVEVRKKYNLPKEFILSLSTLEPRKNLRTLIKAFVGLKKESNLAHSLVLAGRLDKKIFASPKLPTADGILPTGFIDESDKAALISAADVFCFPSLYEGFGLPALEALACGTPLLASDIPALREVVGDAATFVSPNDIAGWKKAIFEACNLQPESRRSVRELTWEKTAMKILEIFQDVGKN